MRVLLIRPDPGNERFGLGPFFRIEPLGLEYIGRALIDQGHQPVIIDQRFSRSVAYWLRRLRPAVVGLTCAHALEYDQVIAVAQEVRRLAPGTFIVAGGHAAAAYPAPLEHDAIDAICLDDGETIMPELCGVLETRRPRGGNGGGKTDPISLALSVAGLRVRTPEGFVSTARLAKRIDLDHIPLPARGLVDSYRKHYLCLMFKPVWLIETARGCPFRCSFCSVWQLYGRSFRERSIAAVADDFERTGPHIFLADDLFWNHPARSLELCRELKRRGVRKRWILAQSRCDLVADSAELLGEWRPIAQSFDIFFGMEAASDSGLAAITKDADLTANVGAIEVSRSLGYGVVANFLVDVDWGEEQFRELWDFVQQHGLQRSGYTLLTPLPGTELFEQSRPKLAGQPWYKYDMHHLLWEPRLGARRFFELYAETWRRSVLNLSGKKGWTDWAKQVRLSHLPQLTRILLRTQRLMKPEAYLREHAQDPVRAPAPAAEPAGCPAHHSHPAP